MILRYSIVRRKRHNLFQYQKVFFSSKYEGNNNEKNKIYRELVFSLVRTNTTKKIINNLDVKNVCLVNILFIFFFFFTACMNRRIKLDVLPDRLKYTNVTPIYKKCNSLGKKIYRPVNILSIVSKVYERVILYKNTN